MTQVEYMLRIARYILLDMLFYFYVGYYVFLT